MTKPTSVTVFGILNLVFGVLGACGSTFSLITMLTAVPGTNPVYDVMRESPALLTWTYVSTALGALSILLLILSGVGLLMSKAWGRLLGLLYGGFTILFAIIGMVMNALLLFPALMELADSSRPEVASGAIGGLVGGFAGGCIGLVYPILLLIFMTRKPVVEYFAALR